MNEWSDPSDWTKRGDHPQHVTDHWVEYFRAYDERMERERVEDNRIVVARILERCCNHD